jgi:MPBQ/MSBQ methyltransferase
MVRIYDRMMVNPYHRRYYGDSGFYNFGYWAGMPTSQGEASTALVDRLVAKIPRNAGAILDVACGMGASTARLGLTWPPEAITGINISEGQLAEARKRAPRSTFRRMDATALDFPDASFDAVMCVEAAFHFDTRDDFLREAFRVLKPGGTLVLSDGIGRRWARPLAPVAHVPAANLYADIATYRRHLAAAGFTALDLDDQTEACLGGFRRSLKRWPRGEYAAGRMGLVEMIVATAFCRVLSGYFAVITETYLLIAARKPEG